MLSYIKWEIKNLELTSTIILTSSGVGYEIIINELIYAHIYEKKEIELFIYHNINENGQTLFWFLSFDDRTLFKELIKISGVWWKVAQNIMSLWSSRLKTAILEDDKKTIESIKWVGKKMAEKIVLELSDKEITKSFLSQKMTSGTPAKNTFSLDTSLKQEILTTLTMMWYQSKKVEEILSNLPENLLTAQDIIPYVVKNI